MSGEVTVVVDGRAARVPAGISVAAALALLGSGCSRISVAGQARAPVCGMGICQECRLLVDGRQRLACQTLCAQGMRVETGTRR
jgi:predicted molibdopterin-dependent oxidoreductase YjgC